MLLIDCCAVADCSRGCGSIIVAGTVRVAVPQLGDWGPYNAFYHAGCLPRDMLQYQSTSRLPGYRQLSREGQHEARRLLFGSPGTGKLVAVLQVGMNQCCMTK